MKKKHRYDEELAYTHRQWLGQIGRFRNMLKQILIAERAVEGREKALSYYSKELPKLRRDAIHQIREAKAKAAQEAGRADG